MRGLKAGTASAVCLAALIGFLPAPLAAAEADAEQLVDALNALFGKQSLGIRGAHTKGQCVKGTFTPTPEAKTLTKSATFAKAAPVLGRFSIAGGDRNIPDGTKDQTRGLAIHIDPDGSTGSDFVTISAPVHFAKDGNEMLAILKLLVAGPGGKPDLPKLQAFVQANPGTQRQGAYLASKPVPASYATVTYFAVHAYTATNAEGASRMVKFKFVPKGGEVGLSDEEAKAKPANYLVDELSARLAKSPAAFDVVALLGEPGDKSNDPSATWKDEDKRKTVTVGTLVLTGIEDEKTCDAGFFDPANLSEGLAGPKDDNIFALRTPAYAISAVRRAN
ncbi:MAG: catalase family peroxidase [Beijerinckiaceae bacterium]|nr:catalase family peroxidase [Beijerinckiaceae bacterium]